MCTAPPRVIVVDDDAAVRNSLKFALEVEGFEVRVYRGGDELLADGDGGVGACGACLIVDQYMPGMTGVELVDRLRRRYADLCAILITAKPSSDLRKSAARRGIREVLEKPLEGVALVESIKGAVDGRCRAAAM
jgi:two-component system, LuxR family, response regulator FixJ